MQQQHRPTVTLLHIFRGSKPQPPGSTMLQISVYVWSDLARPVRTRPRQADVAWWPSACWSPSNHACCVTCRTWRAPAGRRHRSVCSTARLPHLHDVITHCLTTSPHTPSVSGFAPLASAGKVSAARATDRKRDNFVLTVTDLWGYAASLLPKEEKYGYLDPRKQSRYILLYTVLC